MKIENLKLKIIFFGTPDFVIPVLKKLTQLHEVCAVITSPDTRAGRGQILTPPPVKVFAQENKIPVLQPDKLDQEFIKKCKQFVPDLFIVASYGMIIPSAVLALPRLGALNIHPSLLPKYRGASPIQTSILDGIKESGVTIIQMDAQMDHGPILTIYPFTIGETDTFATVAEKAFQLAADLLPQTIEQFCNGILTPREQDHKQATICGKIKKDDAYIDLLNPPDPEKLRRMIRAYYPWPVVWSKIRSRNLPAGRQGQELRIKFLPNNMLQLEGKKPVKSKDFLNAYPQMLEIIEQLGIA